MSARVRPPAVAGSFYPADPRRLAETVDLLLRGAGTPEPDVTAPVALVAPHAGYVYSGPIAASAYVRLLPWRIAFDRVVVVAPAHRVPVRGLALSSADAFATPLGDVLVDRPATEALLGHAGVSIHDAAHRDEHAVEVHLPFLQRVLAPGWALVPALAGGAPTEVIADALATLWGAPRTLVVISTDLSHYHDLATARRLDAATVAAIEAGDWRSIDPDRACGASPVRAALALAAERQQHAVALDVRTSGDTAGPDDRVVGYASFVVR